MQVAILDMLSMCRDERVWLVRQLQRLSYRSQLYSGRASLWHVL